jgi:hypothetical protein
VAAGTVMTADAEPNEVLIYTAPDATTRVQLRFVGGTVLMTQKQMGELFGVGVPAIAKHLAKIFDDGELIRDEVISELEITAADGKRYPTAHYNLDAIISVGYRVSSKQATKFRQWATRILTEFAVKGHVLDVERLKDPEASDYFAELLEKIKEIRSSEANVWKRLLELTSLCVDYDEHDEAQRGVIYAHVQNMMHWGVTRHTAAEIINDRVNADQDHCGVRHFKGQEPTVAEAQIAKNFYGELDLQELNLLTVRVLDFFQDQSNRRLVVRMADFPRKLGDFMKFDQRAVLHGKGSVSMVDAKRKASTEMRKYGAALRTEKENSGEVAIKALQATVKSVAEKRAKSRK